MTSPHLPWISGALNAFAETTLAGLPLADGAALRDTVEALALQHRVVHEQECLNLNPATNLMNPRAEALLAAGLGNRPSLGHPGDKYEMGLEAVERIELIARRLAGEVFRADYAEIRVGSGALANLYGFMATCRPGDRIIVPPPAIGGHVTHDRAGAAGYYGLDIHYAPVDPANYTVDLARLREQARQIRPALITIGGSLNLRPHPVRQLRQIADDVGAVLLADAAHQCGLFAGGRWPNPLDDGAHLLTMSTYKSLGGPAGGLIVSRDAALMQRIDAIAYPGLTANSDAARAAALAITLLDWRACGPAYAAAMVATSRALAQALADEALPVFRLADGTATESHQFAVLAAPFGGGQRMARQLRRANMLSCGIGLPVAAVADDTNGLRLGTPEIVRSGMGPAQMPAVARLVADSLLQRRPDAQIAADVSALRRCYPTVQFTGV